MTQSTAAPTPRVAYIWDHPESRVQFMEAVLKDREWEAEIIDPLSQNTGAHPLTDVYQRLAGSRMNASLGYNQQNQATLTLKKFGSDSDLLGTMRGLGITRGVEHAFGNLGENLGPLLERLIGNVKKIAQNPAQMVGLVYLFGDLIQVFAGLGNKQIGDGEAEEDTRSPWRKILDGFKKLANPANLLQSLAGVAAATQSLIYLFFAKPGEEKAVDDLFTRAERALEAGHSLTDTEAWLSQPSQPRTGPLGALLNQLDKHPIESGIATQITGQLSLLSSGGLRLMEYRNKKKEMEASGNTGQLEDVNKLMQGSMSDMMNALFSITGWSLLLYPEREHPDRKELPWTNPQRAFQEFESAPHKVGAAFNTAASFAGLFSGYSKSNPVQLTGNVAYLAGDAINFFVKKSNYGEAGANQDAVMADAAAVFFEKFPVVLGAQAKAKLIVDLARHLARHALENQAEAAFKKAVEEAKTNGTTPPEAPQVVSEEDIKTRAASLEASLAERLNGHNAKLDAVVEAANTLLAHFPPKQQPALLQALATQLCALPAMEVTPQELMQAISPPRITPMQQPTMHDVAEDVSALVFAIPGAATAAHVNALFDTLSPHMDTRPRDIETLDHTMTARAHRTTGTPIPTDQRLTSTQPALAPAFNAA